MEEIGNPNYGANAVMKYDNAEKANDRQVGGDHYRQGALQHWDLVHRYQMDYFTAQITRYLSRAHLKNGRQDYAKAVHYIDKRNELGYPEFIAEQGGELERLKRMLSGQDEPPERVATMDLFEFCEVQKMPPLATRAFFMLLSGRSDLARDAADHLAATFYKD